MWKSPCLRYLTLLLCVVVPCAYPDAATRDQVYGLWVSPKGTVFAIAEAAGRLQAEVLGMRKPRLDKKNPLPELRKRPLVGLQVLSDYQFQRGVWRGRIYDPGSGHTFKSHIKRDSQGNLRVRGYVGLALFGKTEVFQPVSACTDEIVSMLVTAQLDHLC